MFKIIERQLKQNEYTDFIQFSNEVLQQNKSDSLQSTLELGLRATSLSQSFALAYRCALQVLLPSLDSTQWAALCVSEAQGNHPRHIKTTVDENGMVNGKKSFVSMAEQAKQLIVITNSGEANSRPLLKAVLVSQDSHEVLFIPMPSIGMLPDISHGSIELNNAKGIILPGDGHINFSKRFRYLEDIHVLTAFTSLVLSKSFRNNLAPELTEKCLVLISAVMSLKLEVTDWHHLHLAGLFQEFSELIREFDNNLHLLPEEFGISWKRDKKIFSIASKARLARTEKSRGNLKTCSESEI